MASKKPLPINKVRRINFNNLGDHMHFLCPECGKESDTQQEWWRHLNGVHGYASKSIEELNFQKIDDKHYKCISCSRLFANAEQVISLLQYHRFLHLPHAQTYSCRHCCALFTRKRAITEHLYKIHGNLLAKIDRAKRLQQLNETGRCRDSLSNREFYLRFLCPLCGKHIARFDCWLQHIDKAHSATSVDLRIHRIAYSANYFCTVCKLIMEDNPSNDQRRRHQFTHLPFRCYFQCAFCVTRRSYKSEILLHFIKAHPAQFQRTRLHLQKPQEWGGECPASVADELDQLLNRKEDALNNSNKNDQDVNSVLKAVLSMVLLKRSNLMCESQTQKEIIEDYSTPIGRVVVILKNMPTVGENATNNPQQNGILNKTTDYFDDYINYVCQECKQQFKKSSNYQEHILNVHQIPDIVTKVGSINLHKTSRTYTLKYSPYPTAIIKCVLCTKIESSKSKMVQHLQNAHAEQITVENTSKILDSACYKCSECGKTYKPRDVKIANNKQCECGKTLSASLYNIEQNKKLLEHLIKVDARLQQELKAEVIGTAKVGDESQLPQ